MTTKQPRPKRPEYADPADLAAVLEPSPDPDDWRDSALCAQTDPETFFPEKGGSTRAAKAMCARCPVRPDCLDHALSRDERFGVWGGYSERERRVMRRTARVSAPPVALACAA